MEKKRSIGFGLFLLLAGLIWILFNTGIIDWSIFDAFIKLWPLLLVAAGISIIFNNNAVKIASWLLVLSVFVGYSVINDDNKTEKGAVKAEETVVIEKYEQTTAGEIEFCLGGTKLTLGSNTDNLVYAGITHPYMQYSQSFTNNNNKAKIRFYTQSDSYKSIKSGFKDSFQLNPDILWDMNMKIGAIEADLDLSGLMVKHIEIDAGAGDIDFILGNKLDYMNLEMNSGAADISIKLPEGSGLKIKINGALYSSNMDDLDLIKENGYYISPGFENSSNKIEMDIKLSLGNLKVEYY